MPSLQAQAILLDFSTLQTPNQTFTLPFPFFTISGSSYILYIITKNQSRWRPDISRLRQPHTVYKVSMLVNGWYVILAMRTSGETIPSASPCTSPVNNIKDARPAYSSVVSLRSCFFLLRVVGQQLTCPIALNDRTLISVSTCT